MPLSNRPGNVDTGRRKLPSLSALVLIALGLGVVVGVFFGETVGFLAPVGRAYIALLQMTVLPYVVISIVYGLGRLRPATARRLAGVGAVTVLVVWAIGVGAMLLMPLSYPDRISGNFFTQALVQPPPELDLLELYVPRNIFASLSQAVVPAVVVFCLLLGVALMGVERKGTLLEVLGSLADAVMRLTGMVVKTAPIGIFALAAAAAGTIRVEEFKALQVYVWGYIAMSLVLVFGVLPLLMGLITGVRFRQVFAATRDALVTGFATGSLLVVLPLLSTAARRLLRERGVDGDDELAMVDVVIPTAFNLPSVGMLLTMSFVLFGAWLVGSPLGVGQYPGFASLSVVTAFGGWTIALPALLDTFRLPADIFELYPLVDVITGRFSVLAAALQLVVVSLIVVTALAGVARFKAGPLGRFFAIAALIMLSLVGALRAVMGLAIDQEYVGYRTLVERPPILGSVPERNTEQVQPLSPADLGSDRLDLIRARGWLRVGYVPDRLPYMFRNEAGSVVGLDAELARGLAADLEVGVEFVRLSVDEAIGALHQGAVDLVMSGLVMTPNRARVVRYSVPYMDITAAFAVRDHLRQEFANLKQLAARERLRIGAFPGTRYRRDLGRILPNAEIVTVTSPRPFFRGELDVDALLLSAEEAAAWTLVYPQYSVAVPLPDWKAPLVVAMDPSSSTLHGYVDAWLEMAVRDGTVDRFFSYWIMGEDPPERRAPRWSLIRDVLGWVE